MGCFRSSTALWILSTDHRPGITTSGFNIRLLGYINICYTYISKLHYAYPSRICGRIQLENVYIEPCICTVYRTSLTYERVQHLVDIDKNIYAAFVIDPAGNISEFYIDPDSDFDRSKIGRLRSVLDIRSATISERETVEGLLGRHKWDVLEYDKLKFIKLYPSGNLDHKMIVVIAACTKDPGDVVDSVIGYMNESEDEEIQPMDLFDL